MMQYIFPCKSLGYRPKPGVFSIPVKRKALASPLASVSRAGLCLFRWKNWASKIRNWGRGAKFLAQDKARCIRYRMKLLKLSMVLSFSIAFSACTITQTGPTAAGHACSTLPDGACYAGPGGQAYAGPGGPMYAGPGGSMYAGPGGAMYAGPGGPLYAGPGGARDAGPGGACYAGPGGACNSTDGASKQCPVICRK